MIGTAERKAFRKPGPSNSTALAHLLASDAVWRRAISRMISRSHVALMETRIGQSRCLAYGGSQGLEYGKLGLASRHQLFDPKWLRGRLGSLELGLDDLWILELCTWNLGLDNLWILELGIRRLDGTLNLRLDSLWILELGIRRLDAIWNL